jgi:hypothetical protein
VGEIKLLGQLVVQPIAVLVMLVIELLILGADHEEPLMYTIPIDAHPFWVAKMEFLLQRSHFSINLL